MSTHQSNDQPTTMEGGESDSSRQMVEKPQSATLPVGSSNSSGTMGAELAAEHAVANATAAASMKEWLESNGARYSQPDEMSYDAELPILPGEKPSNSQPVESFVKTETKLVNRSKLAMYLVLFIAAAASGVGTYLFMEKEDVVWYEDEFEEFAEEVFESTQNSLLKADQSVRGLTDAWTSMVVHPNHHEDMEARSDLQGPQGASLVSHPNMTLPNYGVRARNFAELGQAQAISVLPVVGEADLAAWEAYAVEHQGWITEDRAQHIVHHDHDSEETIIDESTPSSIRPNVVDYQDPAGPLPSLGYHLPAWQVHPVPPNPAESTIMVDYLTATWFRSAWNDVVARRAAAFTSVLDAEIITRYGEPGDGSSSRQLDRVAEIATGQPISILLEPIFDSFAPDAPIIGVAVAAIAWADILNGILEGEAVGMVIDVEHRCKNQEEESTRYSFRTTSRGTTDFIGINFKHNSKYDSTAQTVKIFPHDPDTADSSDDRRLNEQDGDGTPTSTSDDSQDESPCAYYVSTHMTDNFVDFWTTDHSKNYTIIVVSIFVFTAMVFFIYDVLVQHRNKKVVRTAERSTAVVSSLFPKNVAEQIMEETDHRDHITMQAIGDYGVTGGPAPVRTKPIADLFSDTTIMFADIVGFTAWSSMREPTQVFLLLETIFNAFDQIADHHSVFKVETVGDCYVAVCGLPEPRKDHAIAMARFSRDCLIEMGNLVKELELELGPDTSNLAMRFGLHSGPVTAGVLRGQRARFQLFGDTMNTASRIESTGQRGRIHISKDTADILIARGKRFWVKKRDDRIVAKGLGELQTYWLQIQGDGTHSTLSEGPENSSSHYLNDDAVQDTEDFFDSYKRASLIKWHSETLGMFLRKTIAWRELNSHLKDVKKADPAELDTLEREAVLGHATPSHCIDFPVIEGTVDANHVVLDDEVARQLNMYVREVASCYRAHPFHNFEHASHVLMSVTKLLSHMTHTEVSLDDPLTQFTLVLTALVHDIDHPGVSNQQLQTEGSSLASMYKTSFAERNSLDIAWKLLMRDSFKDLRRTIYTTKEEFDRFKQLLIHALLVTDIVDRDLQTARKKRWGTLFGTGSEDDSSTSSSLASMSHQDLSNHQKTAVLEHIIQVSDVAHTMQHWNVYRRWNSCFFKETHDAYNQGRSTQNPADNWYTGEIAFFDFYIIPLAHRLNQCPAFGASGKELLRYALNNRAEWLQKGKEVVRQLKRSEESPRR